MKKLTSLRLVLAVAVAATTSMLAACGSGSSPSSPATTTGTLNYGFDLVDLGQPVSFDPSKAVASQPSTMFNALIYDRLLRLRPDGSMTPELATKAEVVNSSTISVTLRAGVKFADGDPLTAADVKYSILRNHGASSAYPFISDVASIDTNGELGLTIHLSAAVAGAFYPLLADGATMPVDPAAVKRNSNPVTGSWGAGPFTLKSYTAGQSITFVKNPKYWNAKNIRLGTINVLNEAGGTPAPINALKAGTVDIEDENVDVSELGELTGQGITAQKVYTPESILFFNTCATRGPLKDVRLRQALNYALNKSTLNTALASGTGQPANSFFPGSSPLSPPDLNNYYAYNPAKAKQLLAAAGYKNQQITMIPNPRSITTRLAQIAQEEWKQVGLNVKIRPTQNFVQDVFVKQLPDMSNTYALETGLEGLNAEYTPGELGNLCNYDNPGLIGMINELNGLSESSPQYVPLWHQVEDFIVKNALGVWGIYIPAIIAYNSDHVGGVSAISQGAQTGPDFLSLYIKN
jgi:peptide/nickel transport system substrate-binding protein